MYALYSKNKPQSDALLSSHGNEFFKVGLETLAFVSSLTQRQVPGSSLNQNTNYSVKAKILKIYFDKQMQEVDQYLDMANIDGRF